MKTKINEVFIDMNTECNSIPAAFVGEKRDTEFMKIGFALVKAGKAAHEENCYSDEECTGSTPYIMRELKSYLLHTELTTLEQMCLISVIAFSRGMDRGEFNVMKNGKVPDGVHVIEMNESEMPEGLKEVLMKLGKNGPKKPSK